MTLAVTEMRPILRDLGGGLIVRQAAVEDAEALARFNANIHRDHDATEPQKYVAAWTLDLMTRPHPTFRPDDFLIVEDRNTHTIVSTLNLISQRWSYDGIEFGVGRPELVGTLAEYRGRGLVRVQFEIVHEWSAARGEMAQGITGIPYFYRQFGYEMGLALGGGRGGFKPNVAKLKDGEAEPYRVRPASAADLPFMADQYERSHRRYLVACVRDEAMWRYEIAGRHDESCERREWRIVETPQGEPVGFLGHAPRLHGAGLGISPIEIKPGVPWSAVTPSVLRYLVAEGEGYAARDGQPGMESYLFWLGGDHPLYQVAGDRLPTVRKPYAWFIRVPDVPGFLRHIGPALERCLATSAVAGYEGELKISFYRSGVRLAFTQGKLTAVEPWTPTPTEWGSAAFPGLTFLQLLFGYRTLDELLYAFADCGVVGDEPRAVLNALFPKRLSNVWPVS